MRLHNQFDTILKCRKTPTDSIILKLNNNLEYKIKPISEK